MAFHIGYKNLITDADAVISVTGQQAGYEKENAYDGFGYDWWRAASLGTNIFLIEFNSITFKDADYYAIWGHDLYDHGATVKIQYFSASSWNDASSEIIIPNNDTLYIPFTNQNGQNWRIVFIYPENLLLHSDDFTQTEWAKTGTGAVTSDAAIAPDGTLADRLFDSDTDVDEYRVHQNVTVADDSETRTFSVFLKKGGSAITETKVLIFYTGGSTTVTEAATVDWSTYTVDAGTISDEGDGWYRVTISAANNSTGNTICQCRIYPAGSAVTNTGAVFAWRAQLEERTQASGGVKTEATVNTSIPSIAGLQLGERLEMPHNAEVGFAVPTIAPKVTYKTAKSESGAFIGGSQLNKGVEGSISFTNIDPAWIRTDWEPFVAHAQTPAVFVMAWDTVTYTDEVWLAWAKGDVSPPNYSSSTYMNFSMDFEGDL